MTEIAVQRRNIDQIPTDFPSELHPLLKRIYAMRGIKSAQELNHSTQSLLSFQQLTGIEKAVDVLYHAIIEQKNILIVGDFDTDGATSTALVITALQKMAVHNLSYIIPDRFKDGYGLSVSVVERAIKQKTDLIITVDNGISSIEAVTFAKQNHMQVIVTDHHLAPEILPEADAIINPNLPDCQFLSKHLAGVGVAFYFMLALRAKLRQEKWFKQKNIEEYNLANLLDLVTLGTVADLVTLDQNNRILVEQGLKRIRSGYCCIGIKALARFVKRPLKNLTSNDLGFYLCPRINAAGRLDNMSIGVELLLTQNEQYALELAEQLNTFNLERKELEQQMHDEAMIAIDALEKTTTEIPSALIVFQPQWHQGIVGILASRLKDKYHRPVIAFAQAENGILKGSGRSIDGIHLKATLEKLHSCHPDLMIGFGGHAMAAGLTIYEKNLTDFTQHFQTIISESTSLLTDQRVIETDGEIETEFFTYQTAKALQEAGPWGAGFPEPLFDGKFWVHQQKMLHNKHLRLVIEPINKGPIINAIAFNVDLGVWPDKSVKKINIIYSLEVDDFNGNQSINLIIRHLWSSD